MNTNTLRLALACATFAVAGASFAQFSSQPSGMEHGAGMTMMSQMKESNQKMMSMPMSGDTDVDFAMMMREHHLSGIKMAEVELRDGKDSTTRAMAKKIIAAQKKEVAQLDAFLAKKGHAPGK